MEQSTLIRPPPNSASALAAVKIFVVLTVIAMLVWAYHLGLFGELSEPKALAQKVSSMGRLGYAAFIVGYGLLQPFGLPGTAFVIAASLIWPWKVAFVVSLAGTMLASTIGFSFARFVARDWVVARMPHRFEKYENALTRNAFKTVFLLRLIFWMPQVLHSFLGVSKVPFWTHFGASLCGYIPPLLALSYFGGSLLRW